jgi:lipopolysaccharide export system protein LptA
MVLCCSSIPTAFTWAEIGLKGIGDTGSGPMVIQSNSLEVNNESKVVTFNGEVRAKRDGFVLQCQEMLVFYKEFEVGEQEKKDRIEITKIVAKGNVIIDRDEGGRATADQAVYYQSDEKVILTGKPVVREGEDFVEGDRITLFLKENRSVVEGDKDKKVRAVFFPKNKGK